MRFIMQLIIFVIFVKISTKKLLLFSLRCRKGNHMARVISIVNQKGGTGKSAGFGYRDCDDSNETLAALMDAVMKDEDIPSDCYIRHQAHH